MKRICKLLSLLLIAAMLLSTFSITASAAKEINHWIRIDGEKAKNDAVYYNLEGWSNNPSNWSAYYDVENGALYLKNLYASYIDLTYSNCKKIYLIGDNYLMQTFGTRNPYAQSRIIGAEFGLEITTEKNVQGSLNIQLNLEHDKYYNEEYYPVSCIFLKRADKFTLSGNAKINAVVSAKENAKFSFTMIDITNGSNDTAINITDNASISCSFEKSEEGSVCDTAYFLKAKFINVNTTGELVFSAPEYCIVGFLSSNVNITNVGTIDITSKRSAYSYPFWNSKSYKNLDNTQYAIREYEDVENLTKRLTIRKGSPVLVSLIYAYFKNTRQSAAYFLPGDTVWFDPIDLSAEGRKLNGCKITVNGESEEYITTNDSFFYVYIPKSPTTDWAKASQLFKYRLSYSVADNRGSVVVDSRNIEKGDGCVWVAPDETAYIRAVANEGWQFSHWQVISPSSYTLTEAEAANPQLIFEGANQYTAEVRAVFEPKDYTITYRYLTNATSGSWRSLSKNSQYLASGASINTLYKVNDSVSLPTSSDFDWDGYIFAGWYKNANFTGSPVTMAETSVSGGLTYYAKFIKDTNATYKLTTSLSGTNSTHGRCAATGLKAAEGDTVYVTITPDKGYVLNPNLSLNMRYQVNSKWQAFTGFTKVSDGLYKFTMPAGAFAVYVSNPFNRLEYTITYDYNGGKSNYYTDKLPTSYNVSGDPDNSFDGYKVDLTGNSYSRGPVQKTGYKWVGWCRNADCSDEPIKYIEPNTLTGNLKLYACWEKADYRIVPRVMSGDAYGTLSLDVSSAKMGDTVTFYCAPLSGCVLSSLYVGTNSTGGAVSDVAVTDLGGGYYSFVMPGYDLTSTEVYVVAEFAKLNAVIFVDGEGYEFAQHENLNFDVLCPSDRYISFEVRTKDGWYKSDDYKVLVNGTEISRNLSGDFYSVRPENGDITITVQGIKEKGVAIEGALKSFGKAADKTTIQLTEYKKTEPSYETTVTGNSTSYILPQIYSGAYILKAMKPGHVSREYFIEVGADVVTQNIELLLLGDVNADGVVDVLDCLEAELMISNEREPTDPYITDVADYNSDGVLSVSDYQSIVNEALWG